MTAAENRAGRPHPPPAAGEGREGVSRSARDHRRQWRLAGAADRELPRRRTRGLRPRAAGRSRPGDRRARAACLVPSRRRGDRAGRACARTGSANWYWPAACAAPRWPHCVRTGAPRNSSPRSAIARSAMTGSCRRSSRSWSARGSASSGPTISSATPICRKDRSAACGPTRWQQPISARHADRAGDRRARYRAGGGRAAGAGARGRGDRGHRRAAAPGRRTAPRRAGRRAGQGREAGPGTARRPADDRSANRLRWPPRAGCAASRRRPARQSCWTVPKPCAAPTMPACLSSGCGRNDLSCPSRLLRGVYPRIKSGAGSRAGPTGLRFARPEDKLRPDPWARNDNKGRHCETRT